MKKFYASLASLVVVLGAVILFNVLGGTSHAADLPRDCDSNSIIYCGGTSAAELAQRYNENKTGDLPAIYQSYGLSSYDMTHADTTAKMGQVNKDGTVVVNGEVVATNASSIGRTNRPGATVRSIGGHSYYQRPNQTAFAHDSITGFVFFDANGQFKAFVLTACGNPGTATPKPKPVYKCNSLTATKISRTEFSFGANASASGGATITGYTFDFGDGKTQSSTTPTISHTYAKEGSYTAKVTANVKVGSSTTTTTGPACQAKVVIETPPQTPVYTCDSLTFTKIDRSSYNFNGSASASGGATITGYNFDFGDGTKQASATATDIHHTYAKDGSYTASMTATVKINDKETVVGGEKCTVKVNVTPEECKPGIPVGDVRCTPCDVPGKEQYPKDSPECAQTPVTPPELPHTGPMDLIGGGIGLGSIIGAAYYWHTSRRSLLSALLER